MIDISDLMWAKYKEHGRGKKEFDCYGFVVEVEKRIGNNLPDFDYDNHNCQMFTSYCNEVIKEGSPKKIDGFVEGAMVLFKNAKGFKNHIGVYVGDGYIAHCNYKGVHLDSVELLRDKIAGVYIWQK